jgi:hypothetical protein
MKFGFIYLALVVLLYRTYIFAITPFNLIIINTASVLQVKLNLMVQSLNTKLPIIGYLLNNVHYVKFGDHIAKILTYNGI